MVRIPHRLESLWHLRCQPGDQDLFSAKKKLLNCRHKQQAIATYGGRRWALDPKLRGVFRASAARTPHASLRAAESREKPYPLIDLTRAVDAAGACRGLGHSLAPVASTGFYIHRTWRAGRADGAVFTMRKRASICRSERKMAIHEEITDHGLLVSRSAARCWIARTTRQKAAPPDLK